MFFNTIVHAGNFADVPMLTAFFTAHADVVRFGSFQLQADTGRGVLGARSWFSLKLTRLQHLA